MLEIITFLGRDPFIRTLTSILCSIILFLIIIKTNKSLVLARKIEITMVVFILFCSCNVTITPFMHWKLEYFARPPLNQSITFSLLLVFAFFALSLLSKAKASLGFLPRLVFFSFLKNPFIWLLPILGLLSSLWSDVPWISFKSGLILIFVNLFAVYFVMQYGQNIFVFLIFTLTIVACLSLIIRNQGNGGLSGILFSKNYLANFMAFNSVLTYTYFLYSKRHLRKYFFLPLALSSILVLITRSGGGIILLLSLSTLSTVIIFLKKMEYRTALLSVILLVVSVFFINILLLLNVGYIENMLGLIGKDLTFTGRTTLWNELWQAIQQKPLLGYGTYGFWQPWLGMLNPALKALPNSRYWNPPHAHQGFLDVIIDLGFLGLTTFLFSFLIAISQAIFYLIKTKNVSSSLPLILLTYVFLSNLSESYLLKPTFVWFTYSFVLIFLSLTPSKLIPDS